MLNDLSKQCHENALKHGFWSSDVNHDTTLILSKASLIHSEISEFVEAVRHGKKKSDHVPDITLEEEELADAIIRILDLAGYLKIDLDKAVRLKMEFNKSRDYLHGKNA